MKTRADEAGRVFAGHRPADPSEDGGRTAVTAVRVFITLAEMALVIEPELVAFRPEADANAGMAREWRALCRESRRRRAGVAPRRGGRHFVALQIPESTLPDDAIRGLIDGWLARDFADELVRRALKREF
jgi:hypothetical protein